jgi:hypothetical protein
MQPIEAQAILMHKYYKPAQEEEIQVHRMFLWPGL